MRPKKEKYISKEELLKYSRELLPLVEKIVTNAGFRLLKLTFVNENSRYYLRVTIAHPDYPISVDNCELVTKEINKEFDLSDPIPFPYFLEVESPGINENSTHEFVLENLGLVLKS